MWPFVAGNGTAVIVGSKVAVLWQMQSAVFGTLMGDGRAGRSCRRFGNFASMTSKDASPSDHARREHVAWGVVV